MLSFKYIREWKEVNSKNHRLQARLLPPSALAHLEIKRLPASRLRSRVLLHPPGALGRFWHENRYRGVRVGGIAAPFQWGMTRLPRPHHLPVRWGRCDWNAAPANGSLAVAVDRPRSGNRSSARRVGAATCWRVVWQWSVALAISLQEYPGAPPSPIQRSVFEYAPDTRGTLDARRRPSSRVVQTRGSVRYSSGTSSITTRWEWMRRLTPSQSNSYVQGVDTRHDYQKNVTRAAD